MLAMMQTSRERRAPAVEHGPMSTSRRFVPAAVLAVAAATAAVVALHLWRTSPPAEQHAWETRFSLISLKLQGELPHVGWRTILSRLGPAWRTAGPPPLARIVAQGEPPCPSLWDTPMGRFWGTARDGRDLDWIVMEQIGWHIYDRAPARVRRGDIVFDVGAHLGSFSRFALDRGAARVVMFEPQPVNARCLERTFAEEIRDGRAVLVEAAVWDREGELSFATEGPGTMGHVDEEGGGGRAVTVRATTFDATIERLGLPRVDFLKMDIEGAERHALEGGRRMLARSRPRMAICIYHRPDDAAVIPRVVLDANPHYRQFTRGAFQAYFH